MNKLPVIIATTLTVVSCGTTFRQIVGAPYDTAPKSTATTVSAGSSVRGTVNPAMVGKWFGEQEIYGSNGDGKATDNFVFNADGSFSHEGGLTMKLVRDNVEYTYEFAVSGSGRYGVEGARVYFSYDPDRASAELVGFDMRSATGSGSIDGKAGTTIKMFTINPMKKSFLKSMKQDHIFVLDSVDGSRLVMTDTQGADPQPQIFVKVL